MTQFGRRNAFRLSSILIALIGFVACADHAPSDSAEGSAGSSGVAGAESQDRDSVSLGGGPSIVRVQLAASVIGEVGGTTSSSGGANGLTSGGAGAISLGGNGGNVGTSPLIVPLVSAFCGDGVRDPNAEECDDGPASTGELCNWACQVTDRWVRHDNTALTAGQRWSRELGAGVHPIAANADRIAVVFVEQLLPKGTAVVRLNTFDALGVPEGSYVVSEGTWPADNADPVVAVLANGDVVVAFTEFGGDGDGLGIALRRLRAGQTQMDAVTYASAPSFAAQQHADILALSDGFVLAYTDESDAANGPDLRVAEYELEMKERNRRALANAANLEGRVSLAPIGSKWGATWRTLDTDGLEKLEAYDASANVRWSGASHRAGVADESPTLIEASATSRLVLFGVGTDPDNDGVFSTNRIHVASLSTDTPGTIPDAAPLTRFAAFQPLLTRGEIAPRAVRLDNEAYLAWSSGNVTSDAKGEDVWFQRVTATTSGSTVTISAETETRLPRLENERAGDQRNASQAILARSSRYPSGALVSVWEDYGETQGTGSAEPEVVVQLVPLSIRRDTTVASDCTAAAPCASGKGRCTSDNQCQAGLICSAAAAPNFDLAPDVGVCVTSNCVVNGKPACQVAGCGTCACGDGIVSSLLHEDCDPQAPGSGPDKCDSDCTTVICGDGTWNSAAGEACDPGAVGVNSPACDRDCTLPVCGDNLLNLAKGETCDPGAVGANVANCDSDCTAPLCGDGLANSAANEVCDPGAVGVNTATCDRDCTLPVCGDNLVNAAKGEACDPGAVGVNTAACDRDCTLPVCGDNLVNSAKGEACDPGTVGVNVATCDKDCTAPLCGDGIANSAANEACDPGAVGANTAACDRDCTLPVCGDNLVNSAKGEACDPGTVGANVAACDNDCTAPLCGDGIANSAANEACDPGAVGLNTAACDRDCTIPVCGDNLVNSAKGEACDPGAVGVNVATCDKDCTAPACGDGLVNAAFGEDCDLGTSGNTGVDCMANCKNPPRYTPTGAYVVEGDMVIPTRTELQQYYAENSSTAAATTLRLGGATRLWNATDRSRFTYCVAKSAFGSDYASVSAAMEEAAAYWELVMNIHFEHLALEDSYCTNANTNVIFNVALDASMPYDALSFFAGAARAGRQIILNFGSSPSSFSDSHPSRRAGSRAWSRLWVYS
ncbi:MAG: hypothetical protein QM784_35340 [Polyangiaceae bacterium]